MIENKCPLCFTIKIKKVFDKGGISYYRCQQCGFLFSGQLQNPNLDNQIMDQYDPAYISYLEESPEDSLNFCKVIETIEKFKSLKQARVLDIGAGTGKLVRFLRRRAIDACGIEPSGVLYDRYLSKEPFFYLADLKELRRALPLIKFDAVIVSDVIEHIRDPHVFFRDLSLVFKSQSCCFYQYS